MKENICYIDDYTREANAVNFKQNTKAFSQENSTDDYIDIPGNPPKREIIDLLREIREHQIVHNSEAATKNDLQANSEQVIAALSQQNAELQKGLKRLKAHLDLFSVRTITTIISLILVAFSTVLLLLTLAKGPLVVSSPLPQLLLIASIGLYLMARQLPGSSHA